MSNAVGYEQSFSKDVMNEKPEHPFALTCTGYDNPKNKNRIQGHVL